MSKKGLIITNTLVVGSAFAAAGIGIAINALNKKNDSTPTQPTPIETTNIVFTNNSINELINSLILIVDKEKLTRDEFNSSLLENIKKNFSIDNKNISDLIANVKLNNQNILEITFNKTNNKYSLDANFDSSLANLNDNILLIPLDLSSNFYTAIPVSNLNNLQSTIESYISQSANQFTTTEFSAQLNSTAFKKVIADAINTTQDKIGAISYSGTTLSIAPNSSTNSKVKFSSTQSSSILINGSLQLSIATSNFYTAISFNEETISNLRQEIINLINTDGVTKDLIDSYLPYEIKDLIDNIDTSNTQKLSNFVSAPTYSDNSIKIQLKNNIGKYKFTSYQTIANNISITNEVIELNNIELSTNPQESPEDWFNWNGDQITGLSIIGLDQKRIVLPSKATSITNYAFYDNKTLVSVDMSLTKITSIPTSLDNNIGVFRNSWNIISISLPQSLTSIGDVAFNNCRSLTSITIPDSVTSIGASAFYNCSSLTSINIPDGVTSIGSYAFYNCSSLTSINIPDSVTSIGASAFYNCSSLTSINIPDGVTSIGNSTFSGCSSLTSINIPDGVTSIGNFAFNNCSVLTSIMMPNSVKSIGTNTFTNVPSTCVMNVQNGWNTNLATNVGYRGGFNVIL